MKLITRAALIIIALMSISFALALQGHALQIQGRNSTGQPNCGAVFCDLTDDLVYWDNLQNIPSNLVNVASTYLSIPDANTNFVAKKDFNSMLVPQICPAGQALRALGASPTCISFGGTDTNTQTSNWSDVSGRWLVDFNVPNLNTYYTTYNGTASGRAQPYSPSSLLSLNENLVPTSINAGVYDAPYRYRLTFTSGAYNGQSYYIGEAEAEGWDSGKNFFDLVNANGSPPSLTISTGTTFTVYDTKTGNANIVGNLIVGGDTNSNRFCLTSGTCLSNNPTSTDTNTQTIGWTTADGNWLKDENFSKSVSIDKNLVVIGSTWVKTDFNASGRVSIGKTSPAYRLDVGGTATTDTINADIGLNLRQVAYPTSLYATLASGGSMGIGTYKYIVTYYTSVGETQAWSGAEYANTYGFPSTATVTTDASNRSAIITMPISSDYRVVGRKIYRTTVNGLIYNVKLIQTIANNTDQNWTDTLSDASLTGGAGDGYLRPNTTNLFITVNGNKVMGFDFGYTSYGYNALNALTVGAANTAYGMQAGARTTTGNNNTYTGDRSGMFNVEGWNNTCNGQFACYTATGSGNTAFGRTALFQSGAGQNNTAIGTQSFSTPGTFSNGIALGFSAGRYDTNNNRIYIDSIDRSNLNNARYNSLITGDISTNGRTDQNLTFNAKIGIKNLEPSAELDVNGKTIIRNDLNVTGNLYVSGVAPDGNEWHLADLTGSRCYTTFKKGLKTDGNCPAS